MIGFFGCRSEAMETGEWRRQRIVRLGACCLNQKGHRRENSLADQGEGRRAWTN